VLQTTPDVFQRLFGGQPAVLVADANSWTVAGEAVAAAFRAAGHPTLAPFIFREADLYAEFSFVDELIQAFHQHRAIPVAIGSGTINDLVKLAAHRTDRPYLCVATAASMDGYTAFGASITCQGSKQTFLCPAPTGVIADLAVIAGAPVEMNSWGYADLLAKITAGADWIVADALGIDPIEPQAWAIVQGRLRAMVANPGGVKTRNPAALRGLLEGLLLGGFAMQSARSSRPASGAEHQFSHLWDMQHHTHNGWPPSHGFKVGIGTIAITALYERLLSRPLDQLDVERCCAHWPNETEWRERVRRTFGEGELRNVAEREMLAKQISPDALRVQLHTLRSIWPELRTNLRAQLIPLATLRQMLAAAGAPTEPEQIGVSRARLQQSYSQAFCLRRRFTVLDLAVRADLLDDCIGQIFGADGLWPIAAHELADPSRAA
jgi:glycerol-1-phosphate dehydrogenase [NAD(P)+]